MVVPNSSFFLTSNVGDYHDLLAKSMQDREEISKDDLHDSRRSDLHYFDSSPFKLMHKVCVIAWNIVDPIDELVVQGAWERDFLESHGLYAFGWSYAVIMKYR